MLVTAATCQSCQYYYRYYILCILLTRSSYYEYNLSLISYLTLITELHIWKVVFFSSRFSSWKWYSWDQPYWHVFVSSRFLRIFLLCWIMVRIMRMNTHIICHWIHILFVTEYKYYLSLNTNIICHWIQILFVTEYKYYLSVNTNIICHWI